MVTPVRRPVLSCPFSFVVSLVSADAHEFDLPGCGPHPIAGSFELRRVNGIWPPCAFPFPDRRLHPTIGMVHPSSLIRRVNQPSEYSNIAVKRWESEHLPRWNGKTGLQHVIPDGTATFGRIDHAE